MPEEPLRRIEAAIRKGGALSDAERKELLRLVAVLREESKRLKGSHPGPLKEALDALARAVEGMESAYPKLTAALNAVCSALARIGI